MSQEFIQIGIDLGTTNSEVAVFVNGKVEIIRNIYQDYFTPSVFGVDKAGNKVVGKKAYEKLFKGADADELVNNKAEVKRLMGTVEKTEFPRLKKSLSAEEVSAEILKSLREDISRKYPDLDTRSAVITVPAYFSIIQSEATKRAGILAGFKHVVLIQEPIAAALSYGFQSSENKKWLVYDFGGGTFDVAVISSHDGILTVLESGGDNYLGGKNIDWAIVEELIVPEINKKYQLQDFTRANQKYQTIFAKLKYLAESAKIDLSQLDKTPIEVDLETADGQEISLNIVLNRSQFERIIEPFIKKTIAISRNTIKNAGVSYDSIGRVVLVGAPTQIPYLRKFLEESLKIKIDTSVDCLTAVATGACLYGLSQKIPESVKVVKERNLEAITLKLNYPALTSETDEPIAGSVQGEHKGEYTLQIQSESGLYTSPKIPLKNGKFLESIAVEPNKTNQYWLYLFDSKGNSVPIEPDSFVITHGLPEVVGAPIAHSIGLAIHKITGSSENEEEFDIYFEKGANLPLKEKTQRYRATQKISRGDNTELPIVVCEGESDNPKNNDYVCKLGINGKELPHDLPIGTDIDVTISVNESRELSVSYYIPSIDKGGNLRMTIMDEALNIDELSYNLEKEKEKFNKVAELCSVEEREAINNLLGSATISVQNANTDQDDKRKANKEIKELRAQLEKISENKKSDKLKSDFNGLLEAVPVLIANAPEDSNKEQGIKLLATLKVEGEKAVSTNNEILLARTNEQLFSLAFRYHYANPQNILELFSRHVQGEFTYTNPDAAQYFIEKGKKAVEANNIDGVKDVLQEIQNLMIDKNQMSLSSMVSGLTRY